MSATHNPWGMPQGEVLQWAELGMREKHLRAAVRQMVTALKNREWAEHASPDPDLQALEAEITALVGASQPTSPQAEQGDERELPPLIRVLAEWEDENGSLAGCLLEEWTALWHEVPKAAVEQSPRQLRAAWQARAAHPAPPAVQGEALSDERVDALLADWADAAGIGAWSAQQVRDLRMLVRAAAALSQPPAAAQREAWISVEERLPKPFEDVLVHPRPTDYCCEAQVNTQGQWSYGEYELNFGEHRHKCLVTHWQPQPAPPIAAQKEGGGK
jgi:hypothetical protein